MNSVLRGKTSAPLDGVERLICEGDLRASEKYKQIELFHHSQQVSDWLVTGKLFIIYFLFLFVSVGIVLVMVQLN